MKFIKTEKIRFQHCDPAGIVFYPRFMEMVNLLVEEWFEEALDFPFVRLHTEAAIPTVDLKIQFKKAGRLGEVLTKILWVKQINRASLVYGVQFLHNEDTVLEGEVTLVFARYNEDKSGIKAAAWPEDLREKIEKYVEILE